MGELIYESNKKIKIIFRGGVSYKIPFLNRIRLRGAELKACRSFFLGVQIDCTGNNNKIFIGEKCDLRNTKIFIRGNNNIIRIEGNVLCHCLEIWIEDDNNSVTIGNNTKITGTTHLACIEGQSIEIGDDCLFSSDIYVRTGDSHSIYNEKHVRINTSKTVKIGNHVWVGHGVNILKGVTIADGCVIATSAVVTLVEVQRNSIVAGVPARIVKENIFWDIKR